MVVRIWHKRKQQSLHLADETYVQKYTQHKTCYHYGRLESSNVAELIIDTGHNITIKNELMNFVTSPRVLHTYKTIYMRNNFDNFPHYSMLIDLLE